MVCTICGALLRHKQIVYEDAMNKICEELNIDYEKVSSGNFGGTPEENEKFQIRRATILLELCEKPCCRKDLMNYVSVGREIK
jgi:hypothetical protein